MSHYPGNGRVEKMDRSTLMVSIVLTLAVLSPLLMAGQGKTVTINSFETGYMKGLPSSGDYDAIAVGVVDGHG